MHLQLDWRVAATEPGNSGYLEIFFLIYRFMLFNGWLSLSHLCIFSVFVFT